MKTNSIQFVVYGTPAPGGSKVGFPFKRKDGSTGVAMAPASKKTKPWMALVKSAAMEAYDGPLLTGAIETRMNFFFDRPQGHYRTGKYSGQLKDSAPEKKTTSPDLTKLVRSTEDALKGILWHDDSQVVMQRNSKPFCDPGERPRVEITVIPLEEQCARIQPN